MASLSDIRTATDGALYQRRYRCIVELTALNEEMQRRIFREEEKA